MLSSDTQNSENEWMQKPELGNYKQENQMLNVYKNCQLIDPMEPTKDLVCKKYSYSQYNGYTPISHSWYNQYDNCIKKIVKKGSIHPLGKKIETPKEIYLTLKEHQKRILHEMLAREDYEYRLLSEQNLLFLCDNVGSGKSISILSLIAERPIVKSVWKNAYYLPKDEINKYEHDKYKLNGVVFDSKLNVFKSNLLIIPHNIYSQWDKYIHDNTSLKFYSIGTKKQINHDKETYDKILNENHLICIKSTMVKEFVYKLNSLYGPTHSTYASCNNCQLIDNIQEEKTKESILESIKKEAKIFNNTFFKNPEKTFGELINNLQKIHENIDYKKIKNTSNVKKCEENVMITSYDQDSPSKRGYIFQRVIIDEADSIHIPAFPNIYSKYTWFVTSSINNLLYPHKKSIWCNENNKYMSLSQGIKGTGFIKEKILKAVDYSSGGNYYGGNNSSRIFKTIVRNHLKFIKESIYIPKPIIKYHKCFTPPELLAVTNAIDKEALKALNAGDVKKAMSIMGCESGTEDDILKNVNKKLYSELELAKETLKDKENSHNEYIIHMEQIKEFVNSAKDYHNDKEFLADILEQKNYMSKKISSVKASIKNWTDKISCIEAKIKGIEERVKGTKDKDCPICAQKVKSPALTPCCKQVFCVSCLQASMNYSKECPMCRQPINITKLNLIVSDKINTDENDTVLPTKLETILKLLNDNSDYRVMIFSEFTTSDLFVKLKDKLDEGNIKYATPSGSSARISNIIKKFKDKEYRVLLLNATCFGAGLNLQFTDEVYILHRMSIDLENQVVGRAQRMGRTNSLKIHYLCYENEFPENYNDNQPTNNEPQVNSDSQVNNDQQVNSDQQGNSDQQVNSDQQGNSDQQVNDNQSQDSLVHESVDSFIKSIHNMDLMDEL